MSSEPCTGRIYIGDDRWGGFVDRCDLSDGHDGPHRAERDGCKPPGWLAWTGTYVEPDY